jgi:hypothetical protein
MLRAIRDYGVELQRLSFQGTADATRQFSAALAQARGRGKQKALIGNLLQTIAKPPKSLRVLNQAAPPVKICSIETGIGKATLERMKR